MFGPVSTTSCWVVPLSATSFGTKVPPASRSTTGWRTSVALISSPSCTCGLVKLPTAAVSASAASTSRAATARAVSSTRADAADTAWRNASKIASSRSMARSSAPSTFSS